MRCCLASVPITNKNVSGRSVSACMRAYESLLSTAFAPTTSFQPVSATEQSTSVARPKKKRPLPDEGPLIPGDRTIQAQPFTTVNTSGDPAYHFTAPFPATTGEPPQKKRGRPNKEEHDRRVREAAERGEVYPPPKKIKTPRQSLEGVTGVGVSAVATPGTTDAGIAEEVSTSKRKPKKAKSTSTAMQLTPGIPARISSLEATARAADLMQIDTEEAVRSTIPETQASEFSAQGSLLAGLREHIAREGPDNTMQSSPTLKEETAPRSELRMYSATPNINDRTEVTQKEEGSAQ
jgi:hypothetical protein